MENEKGFRLDLSSIKVWISIITIMVPLLVSGSYKIFELIRYEGLKYAKNDDEKYRQHMDNAHLYVEDSTRDDYELKLNGKVVSLWVFKSDGCAFIRWIDYRGMVLLTKVLPNPELLEKKDLVNNFHSINNVHANGEYIFDFGVHLEDRNFVDYPSSDSRGNRYFLRIYADKCQLVYSIDRQGYSYGWQWTLYQHSVR